MARFGTGKRKNRRKEKERNEFGRWSPQRRRDDDAYVLRHSSSTTTASAATGLSTCALGCIKAAACRLRLQASLRCNDNFLAAPTPPACTDANFKFQAQAGSCLVAECKPAEAEAVLAPQSANSDPRVVSLPAPFLFCFSRSARRFRTTFVFPFPSLPSSSALPPCLFRTRLCMRIRVRFPPPLPPYNTPYLRIHPSFALIRPFPFMAHAIRVRARRSRPLPFPSHLPPCLTDPSSRSHPRLLLRSALSPSPPPVASINPIPIRLPYLIRPASIISCLSLL
ncbi:hypothetical protein B0H16DRAFT_1886737 [Mycena metata]|uniref:Uncharacterized protein n=1 Tax=Mycena metata TaxID=1033252 RepID=A0AAD7NCI5_9AGAR|nr:hypothetical protein B0H16DRAFT_1886737 [Mycena metata]